MSAWLKLGGSFLIGAIPFSNIVARASAGVDLRDTGTGTVSAVGVYRLAGGAPFAVACLLDMSKGAAAVLLAGRRNPMAAALAAGLTVASHNWSFFLRGAGGRGVLPAMGALLVTVPSGGAVLAGGLGAGRLARNTALGCFAGQLALVPVLATRKGKNGAVLGAAVVLPMIAKRLLGNSPPLARTRPRVYLSRALYDCDDRIDGLPVIRMADGLAVDGRRLSCSSHPRTGRSGISTMHIDLMSQDSGGRLSDEDGSLCSGNGGQRG